MSDYLKVLLQVNIWGNSFYIKISLTLTFYVKYLFFSGSGNKWGRGKKLVSEVDFGEN